MSDKPTETLDWANAAAPADIAEPAIAKKAEGWLGHELMGHAAVNWILQNITDWFEYLDTAPTRYTNLGALIADTPLGHVSMLCEGPVVLGSAPGDVDWSILALGSGDVVCTDGRFIAVAETVVGAIALYDRDTGAQIGGLVSLGGAVFGGIHMDGDKLCIGVNNFLHVYDYDETGLTVDPNFPYDHGAQINDVYSDGGNFLLTGALSGGIGAREINRSTGALVASRAGTAGQRILRYNGHTYIAEDGLSIHRFAGAINAAPSATFSSGAATVYGMQVVDGGLVFISSLHDATKLAIYDLTTTLATAPASGTAFAHWLGYDGRYVWALSTAADVIANRPTARLRAYRPDTLEEVFALDPIGVNSRGLAADAGGLFILHDAFVGDHLSKIYTHMQHTLVKVTDYNDVARLMTHQGIPMDPR